jgi:hypothetical protein
MTLRGRCYALQLERQESKPRAHEIVRVGIFGTEEISTMQYAHARYDIEPLLAVLSERILCHVLHLTA